MDSILSLTDMRYSRGGDFSLQVDRADFAPAGIYLLSGSNGAGKSTLLHVLALLLEPNQGEIRFAGQVVATPKDRHKIRQQITLVEQAPFLFDTTVYQNLAFGLRLRDVRGNLQHERICRALKTVGLEGFEKRHARGLSGGETRRVALARAMVLRPRVLLLDEPTAGLDTDFLPIFEQCLTSLAARGVTIIMASHDSEQPRRLNGTVFHLKNGRLDSLQANNESSGHSDYFQQRHCRIV